jgi:hypothetical protein
MREAQSLTTVIALQESAYLHSRFEYLLTGIATDISIGDDSVIATAGLRSFLNFINGIDRALGERLSRAIDGPKKYGETALSSTLRPTG